MPPESVRALFREHYPEGEEVTEILEVHSEAVARLSLEIGAQLEGVDLDLLEQTAWLHDIGIRYTYAPGIACHGDKPYLWHGVIGREICENAGLTLHGLVCERHVGTGLTAAEVRDLNLGLPERDMLPLDEITRIVCYADKFFSKSSSDKLPLQEVRRRLGRHGQASLARFEAMHHSYGFAHLS